MCLISTPSMPLAPPPPPPITSPTEVAKATKSSRDKERKRIAAARGRSSTILTGSLSEARTKKKTLLGA